MFGQANLRLKIGLTLGMLKNTILALFTYLCISSCSQSTNYEKADNALSGGRYFLESYNQGDIKMAKFYILDNPENIQIFDSLSKAHRALDKEGRQLLRQSSIQVNEVQEINKAETHIKYQLSSDAQKRMLKVIQTPDGWKVDLKFTYRP